MSLIDLHQRYCQQAGWTKSLRDYLIKKIPLRRDWKVIEFGCGTGAILEDISSLVHRPVGIDLDLNSLGFHADPEFDRVNADAYQPPFRQEAFDLIICHYFLLWLAKPEKFLMRAAALLKPKGYIALFAEPDYASRKSLPASYQDLASLQNDSLVMQGVNLQIGRSLGKLLKDTGFHLLEFGKMSEESARDELSALEKYVLKKDLDFLGRHGRLSLSSAEIDRRLQIPVRSWHVPTYFALAQIKKQAP